MLSTGLLSTKICTNRKVYYEKPDLADVDEGGEDGGVDFFLNPESITE